MVVLWQTGRRRVREGEDGDVDGDGAERVVQAHQEKEATQHHKPGKKEKNKFYSFQFDSSRYLTVLEAKVGPKVCPDAKFGEIINRQSSENQKTTVLK